MAHQAEKEVTDRVSTWPFLIYHKANDNDSNVFVQVCPELNTASLRQEVELITASSIEMLSVDCNSARNLLSDICAPFVFTWSFHWRQSLCSIVTY